MDLFGAAGHALNMIFTWQYLLYMVVGVTLGNIIGIIPGIGGNFCLAILIPFIFWMDPILAIGFLEGAHASCATGGAVTAILVNVPGDALNAATCLDGYPMTKKGEGGRALGASTVASGVGGVIGAVVLFICLPLMRPLVLAMGPAEVFALILVGITMIAFVGEGNPGRSLLSGLLGLLLSLIGEDQTTGVIRFNFGTMYLMDGLDLIPVMIGMFAFSEMLILIKEKRGIVAVEIVRATASGVLQGCLDCWRHWWLLIRTSIIGTFLGAVPGVGGTVCAFVAYGHAVQTEKNPETFGTGRVEGVIAPEAANNSKEGGALVPTLAFGIPGTSGMALLLGAFTILGLEPGPKMLTTNLSMTLVIVWTLALANILAALQILVLANPLARIAFVRPAIIVPCVFIIAALGAYASDNNIISVVVAGVFGLLGFVMKRFQFSRATLIIGLVLGKLAEKNYNLSMTLFGPGFVFRPFTGLVLLGVAGIIIWSFLKPKTKEKNMEEDDE